MQSGSGGRGALLINKSQICGSQTRVILWPARLPACLRDRSCSEVLPSRRRLIYAGPRTDDQDHLGNMTQNTQGGSTAVLWVSWAFAAVRVLGRICACRATGIRQALAATAPVQGLLSETGPLPYGILHGLISGTLNKHHRCAKTLSQRAGLQLVSTGYAVLGLATFNSLHKVSMPSSLACQQLHSPNEDVKAAGSLAKPAGE